MNVEAVYRTAPATPGMLFICIQTFKKMLKVTFARVLIRYYFKSAAPLSKDFNNYLEFEAKLQHNIHSHLGLDCSNSHKTVGTHHKLKSSVTLSY